MPQMPSGVPGAAPASVAPSMFAVIATISDSYLTALGQRSVCRGLDCELMAYTRFRKSMCSASPL